MEAILRKFNLEMHVDMFVREKISPDIVNKLSENEFKALGITNSADIMKLRIECITFGKDNGKSKFQISKNMIQMLLETGFCVSDIAKLLSVSERTIYRRMNRYNIQVHSFTDIDIATLDTQLKETLVEFPRCGEAMIRQILATKGIKIKRSRLRDRLHKIDTEGIMHRRRRRLHRRIYNVPAPNHLWHIDTNHQLIRWRLVIAGGVDGFSRFVVYLKCVDNNKAQTIYNCFMEGVLKYGMPIKVRSDKGMENFEVAQLMLENEGHDMITGKSTHNQRVERMWRDIYEGVLCFFYDLFYFMEEEGILDPSNELHVFALHFVYLRRINDKLEIWRNAWAYHRLRTVHSSPSRLFMAGMVHTAESFQRAHVATQAAGTNNTQQLPEDNPRPVFERPSFHVSLRCKEELEQHCSINITSTNFGIDIFQKAVEVIARHHE